MSWKFYNRIYITKDEQNDSRDAKYTSNQNIRTVPPDFDITGITWGPGICPICEKVSWIISYSHTYDVRFFQGFFDLPTGLATSDFVPI